MYPALIRHAREHQLAPCSPPSVCRFPACADPDRYIAVDVVRCWEMLPRWPALCSSGGRLRCDILVSAAATWLITRLTSGPALVTILTVTDWHSPEWSNRDLNCSFSGHDSYIHSIRCKSSCCLSNFQSICTFSCLPCVVISLYCSRMLHYANVSVELRSSAAGGNVEIGKVNTTIKLGPTGNKRVWGDGGYQGGRLI